MSKDTKFIFILLAIVVILVGLFVWKIASPPKEKVTNAETSTNKVIEQEIINSADSNENNSYNSFTDVLIVTLLENVLEENSITLKIMLPSFIVVLAITVILIIIRLKSNFNIHKRVIIGLVIFSVIFGINTFRFVLVKNAIEYSIETKSWYLEKDIVKDVSTKDGETYVHLEKHGKQQLSSSSLLSSILSSKYKKRR